MSCACFKCPPGHGGPLVQGGPRALRDEARAVLDALKVAAVQLDALDQLGTAHFTAPTLLSSARRRVHGAWRRLAKALGDEGHAR